MKKGCAGLKAARPRPLAGFGPQAIIKSLFWHIILQMQRLAATKAHLQNIPARQKTPRLFFRKMLKAGSIGAAALLFSFSEARAQTLADSTQLVRKAPLADTLDRQETREPVSLVGAERIRLELPDNGQKRRKYVEKYRLLVDRIASFIGDSPEGRAGEKKFMDGVWAFLQDSLKAKYGENRFGFLYESIRRDSAGEYDCETSTVLAYDVGRKLGLSVGIIYAPSGTGFHVLVKTENYFFETTSGSYYPMSVLDIIYPVRFDATDDPRRVQRMTYNTRGNYRLKRLKIEKALEDFWAASRLPGGYYTSSASVAVFYLSRIFLGFFDSRAISEIDKAIRMQPGCPMLYSLRARCYAKAGEYEKAVLDMERAIELVRAQIRKLSPDPEAYRSRQDLSDDEKFEFVRAEIHARLRRNSELKDFLVMRGKYYLRQGYTLSAIGDLTEALTYGGFGIGRQEVKIYNLLADAYEKRGNLKAAMQYRSSSRRIEILIRK